MLFQLGIAPTTVFPNRKKKTPSDSGQTPHQFFDSSAPKCAEGTTPIGLWWRCHGGPSDASLVRVLMITGVAASSDMWASQQREQRSGLRPSVLFWSVEIGWSAFCSRDRTAEWLHGVGGFIM